MTCMQQPTSHAIAGAIFGLDGGLANAGFLDELRAAGVRMVEADGSGEAKEALQAFRSALEVLGTPKGRTWVFADNPQAVRAANDDGFPTVCVYRDRLGLDLAFCTEHSDILVRGCGELSLALLDDYAAPAGPVSGVLRALVVDGSPDASSASLVARLAEGSDYVIAADRGATVCREAGVAPHMLCGDADSMGAEVLAWAEGVCGAQIRYPSEKYATDLALAVACARHEAARQGRALELTVTCASGGRPDHALAALGILAAAADVRPRLVEDDFELRVLSTAGQKSWTVGAAPDAVGATFSALPLVEGTVVSETGMHWELDRRSLSLLTDEGVSNVVEEPDATVTCHEGLLATYLIRS